MGVLESLTHGTDTSVRVSDNTEYYNQDGELQGRTNESLVFNTSRPVNITINGQAVACYRYFDTYTRESKFFPIETQHAAEEEAVVFNTNRDQSTLRQSIALDIPSGGAFCRVTASSLRVRDLNGDLTGRLLLNNTIIEIDPETKVFQVNGEPKLFYRIKGDNDYVASDFLAVVSRGSDSSPIEQPIELSESAVVRVRTNGGRLNVRDSNNQILGRLEDGSMVTPAEAENITLNGRTYIPISYNNRVAYVAEEYTA